MPRPNLPTPAIVFFLALGAFAFFAPHATTTLTCFGQYGNGNFVQ